VPLGHNPAALVGFTILSEIRIPNPHSVFRGQKSISYFFGQGCCGALFTSWEKKIHGIHKNPYSIEIPWNPYSMGKFHGIRTVWI
jgi:hypothetical protein